MLHLGFGLVEERLNQICRSGHFCTPILSVTEILHTDLDPDHELQHNPDNSASGLDDLTGTENSYILRELHLQRLLNNEGINPGYTWLSGWLVRVVQCTYSKPTFGFISFW